MVFDPRFRGPEGFPRAEVCLPLSCAVACAFGAIALRLASPRFAAWCALSIVGQAASLQLIKAGPLVGYQHYLLGSDLMAWPRALALMILLVQLTVVSRNTRGHWSRARSVFASLIPVRIAIGTGILIVSSAALSRNVVFYGVELAVATSLQVLNLLTVVHAVANAPEGWAQAVRARLLPAPRDQEVRDTEGGQDWWVLGASAGCILLAGFLSYAVYERHPHIPDEVAYLYQAKYMAAGAISMPAPPDPQAFDVDLMTNDGTRWYSLFPPGWPGVLAFGVAIGAFWLVNPILSGINVFLTFALMRRIVSKPSARLIALLLACSPWHLFMGMSLMSHTWTLTCLLVGAIGVQKNREFGSPRWAFLGGLCAGIIVLIRPMDALIAGLALGAWIVLPSRGRMNFSGIVAFGLGALLSAGTTLPYNTALTGHATEFPLMAYFEKLYGPKANALGFGPDRGFGWTGLDPLPGYGPIELVINGVFNFFAVNVELLGWSCGSLLLLTYCLCHRRLKRLELTMAAFIVGVIALHGLYWFNGGPDFGARYWYLIIVPCLILTASGLERLVRTLDGLHADFPQLGARAVLSAALLCSFATVNFIPWRAIDKYHDYRRMRPDIRTLARTQGFGRSLVFIRGERAPDYASAAIYNPIDLRADAPVYARDVNKDATRLVLEAYRDRPVWFVDGPTITGGPFRIVAGPVSALTLLTQSSEHGFISAPSSASDAVREGGNRVVMLRQR
jgi:hypothetical protein